MSVLLIVIGLALLAAPAALARRGQHLSPAEWCRTVTACLRMGRLAVHAGLLFAFGVMALQAAGAEELAHTCHRAFAAGLPAPWLTGWLAGGAFVVSLVRAHSASRRVAEAQRLLRAEPWLGEHRIEDGVELVVLPCPEPLAYAVPGRPGQITVTRGLTAALDDEEMGAVLRHEHAHLRLRHHAALALGCDVEARFGWFPPTRRSVACLRLAIERWADEDSASVSERARPAVRRALLKTVALAVDAVPAFTDVETVAARLVALAGAPPRPRLRARLAALGPLVSLSGLAAGAVMSCVLIAHHGMHSLPSGLP